MSEDEALDWLHRHFEDRRVELVLRLAALVIAESANQNLIAPSTIAVILNRHIVDSAQLVLLARHISGTWIDIGTGAGFPGLVVACLVDSPVVLVEPRARRAAFLQKAADDLGRSASVTVCAARIEIVRDKAAIISARAVAPLDGLFDQASHCALPEAQWLLPKGKTALDEVARAKQTWHGSFHVEHSVTDPDGLIVVASKVSRR